MIVDGGFRETAHGREEESSALSVVVKPAGTVHADVVGPRGARTVFVEITDEVSLLAEVGDLGSWRWLHAGPGVGPLLRLRKALRDADTGPDPEEVIFELLSEVAEVPAPRPGDAPSWVRRAREALDALAPEGIRVRDLAAGLGFHPATGLIRSSRRRSSSGSVDAKGGGR